MGHRVLVVEDDATLRKVIRMLLEREGYEVDEAPHGAEAWTAIQAEPPSAAVVDLKMPVMDGRQLISHMRADARTSRVPVVLLSGFGDEARDASADAIIGKPFEPQQLLELLRRLVGG